MSTTVFRLHPNQDLRTELERVCSLYTPNGCAVVTCVGSLQKATLRMAGANETNAKEGPFEILSLVGTWTPEGGHFHISLSDSNGVLWGGHLCVGCEIYTTAEIVLLDIGHHHPKRVHDPATGYPELQVKHRYISHTES